MICVMSLTLSLLYFYLSLQNDCCSCANNIYSNKKTVTIYQPCSQYTLWNNWEWIFRQLLSLICMQALVFFPDMLRLHYPTPTVSPAHLFLPCTFPLLPTSLYLPITPSPHTVALHSYNTWSYHYSRVPSAVAPLFLAPASCMSPICCIYYSHLVSSLLHTLSCTHINCQLCMTLYIYYLQLSLIRVAACQYNNANTTTLVQVCMAVGH